MECSEDKAWFCDNIEKMKLTMFRVSFVLLHNQADCEDASGNAVLLAYEKLYQLKDRKNFRAWFITILKNECYKVLRKQKMTVPLEDSAVTESTQNVPDIDLYRALSTLKEDQRISIVLYYLEGYSVKEIAKVLGAPTGTVKSRLSRARTELKARLEEKVEQA